MVNFNILPDEKLKEFIKLYDKKDYEYGEALKVLYKRYERFIYDTAHRYSMAPQFAIEIQKEFLKDKFVGHIMKSRPGTNFRAEIHQAVVEIAKTRFHSNESYYRSE
jgi:hypothetical protein